jgi:hypothetical protein
VEADEVDFFAAAVFGYLQEIEDAEKAGCACEFRRDVGKADGLDGIDFNFAFFHSIASADFDARGFPDANAQGDVASTNAIAETLRKHHGKEFTLRRIVQRWVASSVSKYQFPAYDRASFREQIGQYRTASSAFEHFSGGHIHHEFANEFSTTLFIWAHRRQKK